MRLEALVNDAQPARETLRSYALSLPETTEEFPRSERVIKVSNKIFVFFGLVDDPAPGLFLALKLPQSGEEALKMSIAKPAGYGLGKHGWVQFRFPPDEDLSIEVAKAWVLESYRAMAPKKVLSQLDKRAST